MKALGIKIAVLIAALILIMFLCTNLSFAKEKEFAQAAPARVSSEMTAAEIKFRKYQQMMIAANIIVVLYSVYRHSLNRYTA